MGKMGITLIMTLSCTAVMIIVVAYKFIRHYEASSGSHHLVVLVNSDLQSSALAWDFFQKRLESGEIQGIFIGLHYGRKTLSLSPPACDHPIVIKGTTSAETISFLKFLRAFFISKNISANKIDMCLDHHAEYSKHNSTDLENLENSLSILAKQDDYKKIKNADAFRDIFLFPEYADSKRRQGKGVSAYSELLSDFFKTEDNKRKLWLHVGPLPWDYQRHDHLATRTSKAHSMNVMLSEYKCIILGEKECNDKAIRTSKAVAEILPKRIARQAAPTKAYTWNEFQPLSEKQLRMELDSQFQEVASNHYRYKPVQGWLYLALGLFAALSLIFASLFDLGRREDIAYNRKSHRLTVGFDYGLTFIVAASLLTSFYLFFSGRYANASFKQHLGYYAVPMVVLALYQLMSILWFFTGIGLFFGEQMARLLKRKFAARASYLLSANNYRLRQGRKYAHFVGLLAIINLIALIPMAPTGVNLFQVNNIQSVLTWLLCCVGLVEIMGIIFTYRPWESFQNLWKWRQIK